MRTVFEARGPKWEAHQLGWKLRSSYATRRRLTGLAGLTSMHEDYRALTGTLSDALDCRKLAIADLDAAERELRARLPAGGLVARCAEVALMENSSGLWRPMRSSR